jgi:hypothetical protein
MGPAKQCDKVDEGFREYAIIFEVPKPESFISFAQLLTLLVLKEAYVGKLRGFPTKIFI